MNNKKPVLWLTFYYSDFISGSLNYIKDFTGHWSLYVTYESDFTFNYSDDITHIFNEFEITKIKEDNNGDEDQKYYNLTSGIYAFNIGGNEYDVLAGSDLLYSNGPAIIDVEVDGREHEKFKTLLEENDYFFYTRLGVNEIYVRNKYKDRIVS